MMLPNEQQPRNPDDMESREFAKEIILEILRQNGGRFNGKTRLYKTFYLSHLYYFSKHKGLLSGWEIVRMPHGPGIDRGDELIQELVSSQMIETESEMSGPYRETLFRLIAETPSRLDKKAQEAIGQAIAFVGEKAATELSILTHEHSRSWQRASNGDVLNIYIDLLDDVEYAKGQAALKNIRNAVNAVF